MSNQDSGNPAAKPPKGKTAARRKARSLAVQALYSWQIAGQPLHEIEAQFRTDNDFSRSTAPTSTRSCTACRDRRASWTPPSSPA